MKKYFVIALPFIFITGLKSQTEDYAGLMGDSSKTYNEIRNAFNLNWQNKDYHVKGKGWKAFKRWEYAHKGHINTNGKIVNPSVNYEEYKKYFGNGNTAANKKTNGTNNVMTSGNWTYIGPPGGVSTNGGAGRATFLRFDPTNANTVYVGSPAGGLWKSTTGGNNWVVMADQIAALGCTDLIIDPTNTNIMYLATGDGDAKDTYSLGVLKSTDGGLTWNTTGLNYSIQANYSIAKMLINPNNHLELWAATTAGLMKTIDGGVSWFLSKSGVFKDLEFKPSHPNTVYAASGQSLAITHDGGTTWTNVPLNFATGVSRTSVAVTAADSNYVYVLGGIAASGSADDYGFAGISKSTDGGQTFTIVSSTPNILGWNTNGGDQGGQAWYDLSIACSSTDKNKIFTGGVNCWKSTNGGTTMTNTSYWAGGNYVHADIHAIEFAPGSNTTVYAGCDGGVFKTTNSGTSWTDVSTGLQIAQQYNLGVSQTNAALTITGWQDNGTNLHNGTGCSEVLGGDGFECLISRTNASVMYGELYYGSINTSTNGGGSFSNVVGSGGTGVDENGEWNTPYIQHPTNANTILVGKSQVYRSTNAGNTWSQVGTINASPGLGSMAYAPSNPNYIYVSNGAGFWVSTNGNTFTMRSLPLNVDVNSIAVDPAIPTTVWICSSGYTAGKKVYVSTNAGVTWQNYSTGLPNVPCHSIVCQAGTNDGLYLGNDVGVFYRDSTMANWIAFSYGLPNVVVDEIEIQVSTSKLRAATYGRGLWETDLYTAPTAAPAAVFSSNMLSSCPNQQVDFYDQSTNLPSSWNWTFAGGTPATSTLQFPSVTYANPGTYAVSLKVSNAIGSDSVGFSSYILINPLPTANAGTDVTICKGDSAQLNASGGISYGWGVTNTLSNLFIPNPQAWPLISKLYNVTVSDSNGCKATDYVFVTVMQPFLTPALTSNGTLLTVTPNGPAYSIQWYYNGNPVAGATSSTISIDSLGGYAALVSDTAGCFSFTSMVWSNVGVEESNGLQDWNFFPIPSKGVLNISVGKTATGTINITILSADGKLVAAENKAVKGGETFQLKQELSQGIYFVQLRGENGNLLGTKRIVVIKN